MIGIFVNLFDFGGKNIINVSAFKINTIYSVNKTEVPKESLWAQSNDKLLNVMSKELAKNKHEEVSIHIAARKNITFTRDFSISTNRGMYVRICGGDYSYHAIGFDMKPLKSF
jgi:hypothetical protein